MEARFFIIIPQVKNKFNLTYEQYIVIQSIHYLSNSNEKFSWCSASKQQIAEFCGIGERTVFYAIQKGIELGLIEKDEKSSFLRTTPKWHREIYLYQNSANFTPSDEKNTKNRCSQGANLAEDYASLAYHPANLAYNNIKDNIKDKYINKENLNLQSYKEESVDDLYPRLFKQNKLIRCQECSMVIKDKPILRFRKVLCKRCDRLASELAKYSLTNGKENEQTKSEAIKKIKEKKIKTAIFPVSHQERTKIQEQVALEERKMKNKKIDK